MSKKTLLCCLFIAAASQFLVSRASQTVPDARPSFAEPAISPDRSEIAFVSGGDIWTALVNGGEARLLVAHPANESRPLYSPDGQKLAFVSTRTGGGDIYVLTLASGELQRLTFDDGAEQLSAWSRDGQWLYFSSTSQDIAGMNDVYRVNIAGGTPLPVSGDRYLNEFFAAPAPDGQSVAFSARGNASQQWWRKGHSHLDESELWLWRDGKYEQLTERGAKQLWPQWSGDGRSLFYVSDRSGAQNLWQKPLTGAAKQLTQFKDGRVLWPNASYDGKLVVFERNFGIWKFDPANGQASEIKITRRGGATGPVMEHLSINSQFSDLALSPDGKKVALVARGEIFAASAKDGGEAVRVTHSPARESQLTWANDSRRLAYVSERDGTAHLFLYDFTNNSETQLTGVGARDALGDSAPRFAPDGKSLAFIRDGRELRVLDLNAKQERVVASGYLTRAPRALAWSPDGAWLAYVSVSTKAFRNVFAVPAAGGESRAVSVLPNGNTNGVSWSPDGSYIIFNTSQRTEESQVVRVDLLLRTPKFREDQFRDLFKEESPRNAQRNEANKTKQKTKTTREGNFLASSPGLTPLRCPRARSSPILIMISAAMVR